MLERNMGGGCREPPPVGGWCVEKGLGIVALPCCLPPVGFGVLWSLEERPEGRLAGRLGCKAPGLGWRTLPTSPGKWWASSFTQTLPWRMEPRLRAIVGSTKAVQEKCMVHRVPGNLAIL